MKERPLLFIMVFVCFFSFALGARIDIIIHQDNYTEIEITSNTSFVNISAAEACENFTETKFFSEFNEFGEAECTASGDIRTIRGSKMFGKADGLVSDTQLFQYTYNYSVPQSRLFNLVFKDSIASKKAVFPTLQEFSAQGGHVSVTVTMPGEVVHDHNCDLIPPNKEVFDLTKTLLEKKEVWASSVLVDWKTIGTIIAFLGMCGAIAGVWLIYIFIRPRA